MRNLIFTVLLVVALLCSLGVAQGYWVPFPEGSSSPEPPNIAVVEETQEWITIDIRIPGISVDEVEEDGRILHKISVPEYFYTKEVGKPRLPVISALIAIPNDVDIEIVILDSATSVLPEDNIYPVPRWVEHTGPSGYSWLEEEFTIDEEFYNLDTLYTSYLVRLHTGNIRKQRIAHLKVFPFQYNPSTDELRCYPYFRIRLSYLGSGSMSYMGTGPLEKVCRNVILNYKGGPLPSGPEPGEKGTVTRPDNPWSSTVYADYLIMVQRELYNSTVVDSFAQWKADYDGFDVAVVEAPWVGPVNRIIAEIHDNIQCAYYNWVAPHMPDGKLGYVLLIGDVKEQTTPYYWYLPWCREGFSSNGYTAQKPNDNWYACVDTLTGDYYPDLLLGRFSVLTEEELSCIAEKNISYELSFPSNGWRKRIFLTSGFTTVIDALKVEWVTETFSYIRQLAEPAGYVVNEIHRCWWDEYHQSGTDSARYWNKYYINQGQ